MPEETPPVSAKPKRARRTPTERELKVLDRFVEVYCWKNHGMSKGTVCEECRELVEYARERLARCPYDPKPKCKDCTTHCFKPQYRQRIKDVMRFSGMYFVKRGRLDWMVRYFR